MKTIDSYDSFHEALDELDTPPDARMLACELEEDGVPFEIFKASAPEDIVLRFVREGCDAFASDAFWRGLSGGGWARLLAGRPELAPQCCRFSGWDLMSRRDWHRLLHAQPELEQYRVVSFRTAEELLSRAVDDGACGEGLEWLEDRVACGVSMDWLVRNMPARFRIWCISERYDQFLPDCPWDELTDDNWDWLLKYRPSMERYRT